MAHGLPTEGKGKDRKRSQGSYLMPPQGLEVARRLASACALLLPPPARPRSQKRASLRTAAAFITPPLPILGVSPQKGGEKTRKHHIFRPQTVGGLKSMLEQSPCQAQALRVGCADA